MVDPRFETIDHTADIAIKAFGDSIPEAFGNAAFAMFSQITDMANVRSVGEIRIQLEAPDMEQLLVDWLSELLYLFEVEETLFSEFEVSILDNEGSPTLSRRLERTLKLDAKVKGQKIDTEVHSLLTEIKAVTYHMLEIDTVENTVQVLFDI